MLLTNLQNKRTKAGGLLNDVCAINAIKLTENDILAVVRHHGAASEPYFYDTTYNHTKQHGPIPVYLNGRCVVAEEIENRGGHESMCPLKWKCTSECRMLTRLVPFVLISHCFNTVNTHVVQSCHSTATIAH